MSYRTTTEEVRALRFDRERIAGLIGRYPEITSDETDEIVTFLRDGPHLDVGLLTSNDGLRAKLDAFMQDHKARFSVSFIEAAAVIAAIVFVLATLWVGWEIFA
jgi:hypothetical protein